ncbi:MAG TPA: zf-TFIIB domain-containing protein, partial [Thermoanaerobaculia bacterium]
MQCPGCRSDMQTLTVAALLGRTADVHACAQCRAFWFEPFEDLHLTRSSTLSLLHLITERSAGGPFPRQSFCPVCHSELGLTHDMQHSTRFQYWSCAAGHGRFMSFID